MVWGGDFGGLVRWYRFLRGDCFGEVILVFGDMVFVVWGGGFCSFGGVV